MTTFDEMFGYTPQNNSPNEAEQKFWEIVDAIENEGDIPYEVNTNRLLQQYSLYIDLCKDVELLIKCGISEERSFAQSVLLEKRQMPCHDDSKYAKMIHHENIKEIVTTVRRMRTLFPSQKK